MKISHSWLQTYFKDTLPTAEKLAELFNAHAFEVEGIEKMGNDSVLDVKVLPDKSHHGLSHRGMAYETGAICSISVVDVAHKPVGIDKAVKAPLVTIADEKFCRRYISRIIDGVNVAESPAWLRGRLEAVGARSISTVVDATNYVMLDVGQPLHAFDADKIQGNITIRRAQTGEKLTLLDGREVILSADDGVIADEVGPLDIAGVKGGKRAEVSVSTKRILMTSCNFDPVSVRRTSTKYNLRNDASKRFENDITPHLAGEAMERVTALVLSLSSGAKAGELEEKYPVPAKSWTIEIDPEYINSVTGLELSAQKITEILKSLRASVETKGKTLIVTPSLDRLDLVIPEDIADEVSRIYGYDKLESKQTPVLPTVPLNKTFYWAEKVKNALVGLGFSETLLYALVPKGAFVVAYPLASDKAALRESIAPKLGESLVMNGRNADLLGLDAIKIFEIGKIFPKEGERTSLCIGVSQIKKKKGVTDASILLETINKLRSKLGLAEEVAVPFMQSGYPVSGTIVELDFDALISNLSEAGNLSDLGFVALPKNKKYIPFSHYPFITRDIALFVPSSTDEIEVKNVIAKSAGSLVVKGPQCFDRFEKDGKKSLAFRMVFQSFEKTLSDEEVSSSMKNVYDAVKGKGWDVR